MLTEPFFIYKLFQFSEFICTKKNIKTSVILNYYIAKPLNMSWYFFKSMLMGVEKGFHLFLFSFQTNSKYVWVVKIKGTFPNVMYCSILVSKTKKGLSLIYWFLRAIMVVSDIKIAINYDFIWAVTESCYYLTVRLILIGIFQQ